MSLPFPPEILCEIALHLPLTEDVVSLTLTNHAVRAALSTPALFKARLLLQKWDIDAWQDEDDKAQRLGDWKRWMRIDFIHCKTLQLFEEASAGGLSPPLVEAPSESRPPSPDVQVRNVRDTRIHFGKTEDWSRRLSIVFPMLISHHRANNILRITEKKYCDAFRAHLLVVTESCHPPSQQSREIRDRSLSTFCWLERACFGLVALAIQSNADTIESVFGDAWIEDVSPDFVAEIFSRFQFDAMALFPSNGSARAPTDIVDISRRYSAGFLIQLKMRLDLHFRGKRGPRPLPLLPPSLPPIDPASQYDEPYELGSPAFVWPWLRDGLAGTPLTGLSSASGQKWVGYYIDEGMDAPPMFFELYLAPPPAEDAGANKLYFRGDGADSVGLFTLEGSSDTRTGVVIARKTYVGAHWWDWRGVITPFGMVGVWGTETQNLGWWWVWPQEWSERSPAPPTVTH